MKPKKIIYLEKILRLMAKSVIWKYKPTIVGVTGSVGKTSAKEAIFLVLSSKFNVRKNEKNYNNEIGLPLTIIGAESGNRSFLKWGKVFLKWIGEMILPFHYPKILVLEMGVDRPGDMDYLLSFIKPTVGVMTNVSGSHLEFFKNIEQIAKEKSKLLKEIPEDGLAILNSDNEYIFETSKKLKIPFLFFGFGEKAKVRASFLGYVFEDFEPQGMSFKLSYQGKTVPIRLPGILAPHLVYASLAAVAAGLTRRVRRVWP
jgi:UDP-N-acetylmuramoyl-tripeptide--D-alanyl-D-alanine ligase